MITIRKAGERGHAKYGWLDTYYSFSFADYRDREHMRFRALRVINEDRIAPGAGFPPHSHKDMEIVTYVLKGAVAHKDSTGGGGVIRPGEVQYMCAGSGVTHSEYNASDEELLHLYQIWLLPSARDLKPGYAQKAFGDARNGVLCLVASPDGRKGSLKINQDTALYASVLEAGAEVEHRFAEGRFGWLQAARGEIEANGVRLAAGDGARIEGVTALRLKALSPCEFLLFDLA